MLAKALFAVVPVGLFLAALQSPAGAQTPAPAGTAPPAPAAGPECSTFDAQNQPTSAFRAGESIVIRGTGFGAGSTVVATFRQGVRAAELARGQASDLGAFSLPTAAIPDTAEPGNGSLVVVEGPRSATCELSIQAGPARSTGDSDTPTVLFVAWGIVLAVIAAFLAFVSLRRWQRRRLHRAMDDLPRTRDEPEAYPVQTRKKGAPAPARVPWLELDDVEIVELGADELRSPALGADEDLEEDAPSDVDDDFHDLIDELEEDEEDEEDDEDEEDEDHEDDDEDEPVDEQPRRRRRVYRDSVRERALENLVPVDTLEDSLDEPEEAVTPQPRRPVARPARPGRNVDRLREAVKDWQTRAPDPEAE